MKRFAVLLLALCLLLGCSAAEYHADEQTILILVELDQSDDVYEISYERMINGQSVGGGGASNADRSRLGYTRFGTREKDPLIDLILTTDDFPADADLDAFSLQLYVRTEPLISVDWDDPYVGTIPVKELLSFSVAYGHVYRVRLYGSTEEGYHAEFLGQTE